jgi:hypothetical protein
MEWSRIRSAAQEVELWTTLAVNSWLFMRGIAFVARRTGSLLKVAEITHLLSTALTLISLAAIAAGLFEGAFLGSIFILKSIFWIIGPGIALSLISLAAYSLERVRRACFN